MKKEKNSLKLLLRRHAFRLLIYPESVLKYQWIECSMDQVELPFIYLFIYIYTLQFQQAYSGLLVAFRSFFGPNVS